jgi:cellulose biosynthesis protein BcsQ
MPVPEGGRIITFYSSTGGTGRSMALANIAWILASNGLRVLAVDWDLESPGLYRYFKPFLAEAAVGAAQGMVDLLNDYLRASVAPGSHSANWHVRYARVEPHAISLTDDKNKIFPDNGSLDYLSAGQVTSEDAPAHWEAFYRIDGVQQFILALRADMKHNYDYVLIDSQIGLNDTASICAEVIPDIVVACFVLSDHSIDLTAQFARLILDEEPARRHIRVLPVPMKIDLLETGRAKAGRAAARKAFAGFPNGLSHPQRAAYWEAAGIPYTSAAAFEENLAVFEDRREPPSLLNSYERLTAMITDGQVGGLPPMDEQTRVRYRDAFTRKSPPEASS